MIPQTHCEIFSARGRALVHIAAHPGCNIDSIASALCLTPRTVWSIIGELRNDGMIRITREGRNHYYRVNLDAPFHHHTVKGYQLRDILQPIAIRPPVSP